MTQILDHLVMISCTTCKVLTTSAWNKFSQYLVFTSSSDFSLYRHVMRDTHNNYKTYIPQHATYLPLSHDVHFGGSHNSSLYFSHCRMVRKKVILHDEIITKTLHVALHHSSGKKLSPYITAWVRTSSAENLTFNLTKSTFDKKKKKTTKTLYKLVLCKFFSQITNIIFFF